MINLQILKYLPLYLLRYIQGQITYLYLLMPILGIFYLGKVRSLPKSLYPLFLMFIPPLVVSTVQWDLYGIKRVILTSLMGTFLLFLLHFYKKEELEKLAIGVLGCNSLYFLFELIAGKMDWKWFYSFYIPWFQGVQGHSNHTGMTLAVIGLVFMLKKKKIFTLISVALLILTASRTSWAFFIMGSLLLGLYKYDQVKSILVAKALIVICILSPLIFFSAEKILTDNQKLRVNELTDSRYVLQLRYIKLFLDKPMGVGVDRAHFYAKDYELIGSSIVEKGLYTLHQKGLGAHSLYTKILCENGIFGYGIFIFLLGSLANLGLRYDPKYGMIFTAFLFGSITLNTMIDFSLYLILAFMLKGAYKEGLLGSWYPYLKSEQGKLS